MCSWRDLLLHGDVMAGADGLTVVVGPDEGDFAAFRAPKKKGEIWVGRYGGVHIGGEHLASVIFADKFVDDQAGYELAGLLVFAPAVLHWVLDHHFYRKDLALLDLAGNADFRFSRHG